MGRSKQNQTISRNRKKDNYEVENIQEMLNELRNLIFNVQQERCNSELTLSSISKTHDYVSNENKISAYLRQKLKNLYGTAMEDAQAETSAIRNALKRINEIKQCLAKQFESSKPTEKLRRGVLLSILQQNANSLPLWVGGLDEKPPPLCGSVPSPSNYIPKINDKVAAKVKNTDGEENWILATITNHWISANRFEVEDVDEGNEKYRIAKSKILPLPIYKANPDTDQDALFHVGDEVLALYPQTTCFYQAVVQKEPERATDNYQLQFEDECYPEGFSPPLYVGQRYVINLPEKLNKH